MNTEVKLAKLKKQQAETEAALLIVRDMLSNPVVELIGGYTAIQYMLHNPPGNPILKFGDAKEFMLESALGVAVLGQQLGREGMQALAGGAASALKALPGLIS